MALGGPDRTHQTREPDSPPGPLADVATACYLVHALGSRGAHGSKHHDTERGVRLGGGGSVRLPAARLPQAIRQALADEGARFVATRWTDAASALTRSRRRWGGVRFGTRLVDSRAVTVAAPVPRAFVPIRRIGGRNGWYYGDWLWRLRGAVDRLRDGGAEIRQTALYDPVGITGRAYWYLPYPAHEAIFRGMLRRIAQHAEGNCS